MKLQVSKTVGLVRLSEEPWPKILFHLTITRQKYIYLAHIPERKVKVKAKRREGRSCSLIMRRLWWN